MARKTLKARGKRGGKRFGAGAPRKRNLEVELGAVGRLHNDHALRQVDSEMMVALAMVDFVQMWPTLSPEIWKTFDDLRRQGKLRGLLENAGDSPPGDEREAPIALPLALAEILPGEDNRSRRQSLRHGGRVDETQLRSVASPEEIRIEDEERAARIPKAGAPNDRKKAVLGATVSFIRKRNSLKKARQRGHKVEGLPLLPGAGDYLAALVAMACNCRGMAGRHYHCSTCGRPVRLGEFTVEAEFRQQAIEVLQSAEADRPEIDEFVDDDSERASREMDRILDASTLIDTIPVRFIPTTVRIACGKCAPTSPGETPLPPKKP